jgi:hypothetical protein
MNNGAEVGAGALDASLSDREPFEHPDNTKRLEIVQKLATSLNNVFTIFLIHLFPQIKSQLSLTGFDKRRHFSRTPT